jgi:hypothetical protein
VTVETKDRTKFVMIPKWIMLSDLSSGAIRLYGVLMSYANNETLQAFPTRKTLANDMHMKQAKSIDPYIDELKRFGALKVEKRLRKDGGHMSSLYTLVFDDHSIDVKGVAPENGQGRGSEGTLTTLTEPTPTSVSPVIPESQTSVAPLLPDGTQAHPQASQADPLGPTWYNSEQRQYILKLIQGTALSKAQHNTDYWDRLYDLGAALEEMFNDDEIIMWLIEDRGWEPPRKSVDKFEAAKWLNELIGTWRKELPGLSFHRGR